MRHVGASFEGKYIHFVYREGPGYWWNWRLRPWAKKLRTSEHLMYGAMVQLSPEEAANLRTRLEGFMKEQGPEKQAGPSWERGYVRRITPGSRTFTCASSWCELRIGAKNESLAKLLGIPATDRAETLIDALFESASEKVVGFGYFGPKVVFQSDKSN